MINYMKSEYYRLFRKKILYVTTVVCFLLIISAGAILYYFGETEATFPYATNSFFYSNVISGALIILIVAFLFNLSLTGNDKVVLKQTVSFGIPRQTIFWSKLILTLGYFLIICAIGLLLMIGLGEGILTKNGDYTRHFLVASFNMLPLIISGFCIIHVLKMLNFRDINTFIIVFFIYLFSGNLIHLLLRPISALSELYKYMPSTLLNDNLMNYVEGTISFDGHSWIVGIVLSVLVLLIGVGRFTKQNID